MINLLSHDESLLAPSRARTPPNTGHRVISSGTHSPGDRAGPSESVLGAPAEQFPPSQGNTHPNVSNQLSTLPPGAHGREQSRPNKDDLATLRSSEIWLEKEYVRCFLHNLHYLHPMLDATEFTARCDKDVWASNVPHEKSKNRRHFFALYNIVVAVGSLIAGTEVAQELSRELAIFAKHRLAQNNPVQSVSSQTLSKYYFRKSRALLGDVFEVCSLESAQTLLLMSLYCQNSLKPHACYMYCGMAVRTALAIGLPNDSMSSSAEGRKAARRTWWYVSHFVCLSRILLMPDRCIYSHEM